MLAAKTNKIGWCLYLRELGVPILRLINVWNICMFSLSMFASILVGLLELRNNFLSQLAVCFTLFAWRQLDRLALVSFQWVFFQWAENWRFLVWSVFLNSTMQLCKPLFSVGYSSSKVSAVLVVEILFVSASNTIAFGGCHSVSAALSLWQLHTPRWELFHPDCASFCYEMWKHPFPTTICYFRWFAELT